MKPVGRKITKTGIKGHQDCGVCHPLVKSSKARERRQTSEEIETQAQCPYCTDSFKCSHLFKLYVKVYHEAISVLGDEDAAASWLTSPNRALDGQTPDMVLSKGDLKRVLGALGRIEHGVYN